MSVRSQYFQIKLFIVSLQDQIRNQLMKSTYANFRVANEATLDLEVIHEDNKPVKVVTLASFACSTSTSRFWMLLMMSGPGRARFPTPQETKWVSKWVPQQEQE
jgi:hypothetical protein